MTRPEERTRTHARTSAHEIAMHQGQRGQTEEYVEAGEASPLLHPSSRTNGTLRPPPPAVISALIRRCRALVVRMLPVEVTEKSITGREGMVTRLVLQAFTEIGGDYAEAVPYCLLQSNDHFQKDAEKDDKSLNEQRALICEVIARRLVAKSDAAWVADIASQTRDRAIWAVDASHLGLTKKYCQLVGRNEVSLPRSTLELAVDLESTIFLSSPEVQRCTQALWAGHLIKDYRDDGSVSFETYHQIEKPGFWNHFDPSRLAVPRYTYYLNMSLWIVFLALYTVSTRTLKQLDAWEVALWVFAAGYLLEDISRWFKIRGLDKLDFWLILDVITDTLFVTSFIVRMVGFSHRSGSPEADFWQLRAFQLLACLAPLIWLQLMKLLDSIPFFGVIQVVIFAMLKQTATFFILLLLVTVGFGQALWALDTADGRQVDNVLGKLVDSLTQALLGDPDYDLVSENFGYPFGRILYYLLTFLTSLILSNILIAFFGSAYSNVVDSADSVYEAYFAGKVVGLTRAPDQFVYLAPFNLIEAFALIPLELVLSRHSYAKLNRVIQSVIFFFPLTLIAAYESKYDAKDMQKRRQRRLESLTDDHDRAAEEGQKGTIEDPEMDGEEEGLKLVRVPFEKLAKKLPNSQDFIEGTSNFDDSNIEHQIKGLFDEMKALRREISSVKGVGSAAKVEIKKEDK